MVDLTGANLVAYLLRVIKDIVSSNPRFRSTLGDVTFQNNQMVQWGNVQCVIKNVTAQGTRLSPDYFMYTQHSRVTVAKMGDKKGAFIEWPLEIDPTRQTPVAGVYYLQVDAADEKTQDVHLTMQSFKWTQGTYRNAEGSVVFVNSKLGVDVTTLTATEKETGNPVSITWFNASNPFGYVTVPCQTLVLSKPGLGLVVWEVPVGALDSVNNVFVLTRTPSGVVAVYLNGSPLTSGVDFTYNPVLNQVTMITAPAATDDLHVQYQSDYLASDGSDYWYERNTSMVICHNTTGGPELVKIPASYISFDLYDGTGYKLRSGLDYNQQGSGWVMLSSWTPQGSQITATLLQKLPPTGNAATNPENIIDVGLAGTGGTLAAGQVFFHTTNGDYTSFTPNADGTVTLPQLLTPGQWLRWEARIDLGAQTMLGKKYQMNGFVKTVVDSQTPSDPMKRTVYLDPATSQPVDPLPGLWLALGDWTTPNDQAAVIINPEVNETYEVFGSKDNISFTLECRANDLQTASDLAELIKHEMLVFRRTNMERDGVTILEAPREYSAQSRDISGLNPTWTATLTFSGMADWKAYVPLVTRMASYELNDTILWNDFQGKLQLPTRLQAVGATMFLNSYA